MLVENLQVHIIVSLIYEIALGKSIMSLVLLHEVTGSIPIEAKHFKPWGHWGLCVQGPGINRGARNLVRTSGYLKKKT